MTKKAVVFVIWIKILYYFLFNIRYTYLIRTISEFLEHYNFLLIILFTVNII